MPQIRNTIQKEQVYSAVLSLANHPTADEVYEKVREECPTISRATVYRILNSMTASGGLAKVKPPGAAVHFDHQSEPHNHAQCIVCGRVYDVELLQDIKIDYTSVFGNGLKIVGHNLIFDAVCGECK